MDNFMDNFMDISLLLNPNQQPLHHIKPPKILQYGYIKSIAPYKQ